MKKINLIYWNEQNFGDALSPYIVEELSGRKTKFKGANINIFRKLVKAILFLSLNDLQRILFPWQTNILGVGSIITWGNSKSKVWGSGFMSQSGRFNGGEVFAVRGPFTAKRLVKEGFPKCEIYGDPALLLPLWKQPVLQKKHKLGIIPHWKETDKFIESYGDRYKIIDLRTKDVDKVLEDITSCNYILSTSLHGLIVPHAYNIPALWIKDGFIDTDGFKFSDYFASVEIPDYNGFTDINDILTSESSWKNLFNEHIEKSLINVSLSDIQKGLIRVAPFPVKKKYKNI